MANDLIVDLGTFMETGDVLAIVHPKFGNTYQWMKDLADRWYRENPAILGYATTGGFELCFWRDDKGRTNVRASVSAYTVKQYLNKKKES